MHMYNKEVICALAALQPLSRKIKYTVLQNCFLAFIFFYSNVNDQIKIYNRIKFILKYLPPKFNAISTLIFPPII